ncbi:MAG: hypothetical protein ACXIU7_03350 [Roseinatronobacter sp.]
MKFIISMKNMQNVHIGTRGTGARIRATSGPLSIIAAVIAAVSRHPVQWKPDHHPRGISQPLS